MADPPQMFQFDPPPIPSTAATSPREGASFSGGGGDALQGAAPKPDCPCLHPQKWTEDRVRLWWEKRTRRRRDITPLAKGTDGRNMMRWPVTRFEQMVGGNHALAQALYLDLRNEASRHDQWKRTGTYPAEARLMVDEPPPDRSPRGATPARAGVPSRPPGVVGKKLNLPPEATPAAQAGNGPARSNPSAVPAKAVPVAVADGGSTPKRLLTPAEAAAARPARTSTHSAPGTGSQELKAGMRRPSGTRDRPHDSSPPPKSSGSEQQARPRRDTGGSVGSVSSAAGSVSGTQLKQPTNFKFSPAQRGAQQQSTGSTSQVGSATPTSRPAAAEPSRPAKGAFAGAGQQQAQPAGGASLGAGAKARMKSAPRLSRGSYPGGSSPGPAKAAGPAAGPQSGSAAVNFARPATVAAPPGAAPSMRTSDAGQRKPRRSLVMEDLGDDTLAQVGSPKKEDLESRESLRKKCMSGKARDDSELGKAPGHARRHAASGGTPTADEDDEGGRKMFDKRELRRRHRNLFDAQLAAWREQYLHGAPSGSSGGSESSRVRVCVRKRPLFDYEVKADEFDVISVRGGTELVVHNCLTKADLRSLFVSHMAFPFFHAFGDSANDEDVYKNAAAPAVRHAQQGGVATLFMFGQTGSGKTHTMAGFFKRASAQLFGSGRGAGQGRSSVTEKDKPAYGVVAFEIAGKNMRDLLDISGGQKELKVMEGKDHRTNVIGLKACEAHGPDELLTYVQGAQAHRATRATQVNDTSSRSHAVFRVWRLGSGTDGQSYSNTGGPPPGAAILTLVDCAGSERREDTTNHDAQTRKDAAEINSTIFALKECFRVLRSAKSGQQPPYRESLLTRVLSDSFSSERALIVAVGTVSPSATDTEHSIGTLRALQQLQGTQMSWETREDVVKPKIIEPHPRNWSEEDVKTWLAAACNGHAKCFAGGLTKGTDGKNLTRWPVQRFAQLCGGDQDLGSRLFEELRVKIRSAGTTSS
eukprot:TRINITY_DN59202_c0_g1_i1.p1 TRINITY_DN59202_c0_g1~~TRINITY_DN59202_c0_g1_i1.p1  ORF type:complete len:981 (-),score=143.75 TRINITY_DN59202_c0_g1_i1:63-3005(-)